MTTELTIAGDLADLRRIPDLIEEALQAADYTKHDIFAIKLALEETLVSAIKHDNQMDPDKRVHVAYTITPERFEIRVTAEGGDIRSVTGSPS